MDKILYISCEECHRLIPSHRIDCYGETDEDGFTYPVYVCRKCAPLPEWNPWSVDELFGWHWDVPF